MSTISHTKILKISDGYIVSYHDVGTPSSYDEGSTFRIDVHNPGPNKSFFISIYGKGIYNQDFENSSSSTDNLKASGVWGSGTTINGYQTSGINTVIYRTISNDEITEGPEIVFLRLYSDESRTNLLSESSFVINDSSNNETQVINNLTKGQQYSLNAIKDYDGNLHASTLSVSDEIKNSYKYQGQFDTNANGIKEAIFTNKESGRWVTASINSSTQEINFSEYGSGGSTRVVGIYIDPLVTSGEVEQFGPHDSQRRFQNDLLIDNLTVKTSGDYDGDGFQEVYWKTNDGTAYLRALMHADGNIQYANYQNQTQMSDYLRSNGYESIISDIV